MTKTCITCREDKPEVEFHLRRSGAKSRRSECKTCELARKRENYHRKEVTIAPRILLTGIQKLCRKCGKEKDQAEFDRNALAKDGFRNHCKTCRSAQNTEYLLNRG